MSLTRQSKKTFRILSLVIVTVIILWSVYQEKKPEKSVTELEFRMVTGEKDGNFQVIMFETSDRFFVLDSAFRQVFEVNDAEVVSGPEHVQILAKYSNLQYRAGLSIGKDQLKKEVRLSRELFNLLHFNQTYSAETHSQVTDSLLTISQIQ